MSTISMTGQITAKDGSKSVTAGKPKRAPTAESVRPADLFPNSAAEVVENIAQSIAIEKSNIENVKKITDIINTKQDILTNDNAGTGIEITTDSEGKTIISNTNVEYK